MDEVVTEGTTPGKKKVGGYILGDTIGEGSFAKVRVATHIVTQERVAIKIIDKRLIVNREYVRKNLRREAAMLRKLNHVNITKLYEVLETRNNYYLVMELAEGGEFMRYLCDRRKLSERETRKFMRQLVSSVEYMHQADLVHRDIKIENFLLDANNNLKVIDFGLSNVLGLDGFLRTQCGSPAYAAPEIFCSTMYGPTVDVWSIGVNMYAMLTGELPFNVDPPTDMFKLHAKIIQGCSFPEFLTKDCKDLLKRLLTVDEESRINLKDVMKHPWMNRGCSQRLRSSPYPNKLTAGNLNMDVLDYMTELGFSTKEVIDNLLENRPVPDNAIYHLLMRRVEKGWGYPEHLRAHFQYTDEEENNISTIPSISTSRRRAIKAEKNDTSPIRNSVTNKRIVEGRNILNRMPADDSFTSVKYKDNLTRFQNGVNEDQIKKSKARDNIEELRNSLKEIDLNNNNNAHMMNKTLETKMKKIETLKLNRDTGIDMHTLDCSPQSISIDSQPINNVDDIGDIPIVPVLSGISEAVTESKQRPHTNLESYRHQKIMPRPLLKRSTSYGTSALTSNHKNDQSCFIIVNSKLAHNSTNLDGSASVMYRSSAHTTEAPSTSKKPKERLRRSNTDPSIYKSFTQRNHQESSVEHSTFHRNAFTVHQPSTTNQNQALSRFAAATFGFPTRIRTSARQLGSVVEQRYVSNVRSTLQKFRKTSDIGVQDSVTLPSIKQSE